MNKKEARKILSRIMDEYRDLSYSKLTELIGIQVRDENGSDGLSYQIEIEIRWISEPFGDLLVLGSIDDRGLLSSFSPSALKSSEYLEKALSPTEI